MPRTRKVNPICRVHYEPREGCPDCEAEQAWERTPAENFAVDPGATSAPQEPLRATDSSSSDLVVGLRALIAQWRETQAMWQRRLNDVEQSPAFVQGVQSTWQIAADELEALLAASRPGRETA